VIRKSFVQTGSWQHISKGAGPSARARAALKIIKAFVRDREGLDAKSRSPLPGANEANTPKTVASRQAATSAGDRHRRKPRRKAQNSSLNAVTGSIEPRMDAERPQLPATGEEHSDSSDTL
jgi:hypothetical protein